MCSYPCFGLSKTGFTPPSQLLKLINFFKKTDTASLPMKKSAAKTASLPMQKRAAKTASLPMQKSTAKTVSLPIMRSAAKTESSFRIYIHIFSLGCLQFGQIQLGIGLSTHKCALSMTQTNNGFD